MIDTFGQVIADLDLLNQNTERDFLKIGGKLSEFIETVSLISSDLAFLANSVSGERGECASLALTAALDRSLEMEARYADSFGGLDGMRTEAGRLKQTLAEYENTVSAFRAVGFLTRIEIARLENGAADFGSLTGDVKSLTENVQVKVQSALDAGARLIPMIESAAQEISVLKEAQLKDLPLLTSEVSASLSSFREIQNRVGASSVRLGARYDAISAAVRKLVVSIQFHDITRQQVEHVIEVLGRMRSESFDEPAVGAAAVLALQSSQLANSAGQFASSVESLVRNLGDISENVSRIAVESRDLFSGSDDENDSFLPRLEKGCAAILARIGQCADADAAAGVAGGAMTETIARMLESVEEIRVMETQMFRVAMNARINANLLGRVGDPLYALADSMGQQASDSRRRSESLVEDLNALVEAATRLSQRSGPETGVERDCSEAMRRAVAELQSSREGSSARISQVIARADRLREDLSATCAGFSAGDLFAEAIGRARATIDERGGASGLSPDGETPAPGWADFAANYTMQSERDVHDNVMTSGARTGRTAAGEEGLGENVEFF